VAVCASCGFENAAGIKFCGECGVRLAVASPVGGRERKTVSVLFCDLVGFTAASDGADPEEVQAALSPYHARARREIERFGGTVEKFIGDAVMAAFGAPVVHEDDPERVVRAGLALLGAVEDLNAELGLDLAVRVGVATGEAVVSTGARPERGEGMLAGDVVNTAARLQTSAPVGGVLVGQATYQASRAAIEYQPHDPVTVKGKTDPLSVWVAVATRGTVGEALTDTSRPMIGREDELSALQRAFTRAVREDSVQLVTIVAEPGLGKSRLVQAFFGWVDTRDELITWRQGRCPSYGDAVTYAALGQIVKAQTGIADNDPPPVAHGKLTDAVHALVDGTDPAAQASWLVARLAPLVGLPAAETPQEELFTAWRRFLETLAATGPVILAIEDLHWADPAMLEFLTHLLEWAVGVPLVIVTTTRPEVYDTAPHWGSGHRNSHTISLTPLSDAENAQLVTSMLGTQVLPADLHAALLATSAGNPLYTREYLNMLTDQTSLTAAASGVATDLAETLPGSVQAVIAARLDTLPVEHKQLLQAAAVVGHTFWAGAAAALTDTDLDAVSARLHDLVRRDYLRPSRSSSIAGQPEYAFSHALIADVAYHQLPRADRAAHHHRAGDWHATLSTGSNDDTGDTGASGQAAVVAHHYTQAHSLTAAAGGDSALITELAGMAADWHTRAARQAQPVDLAAAENHTRTALDLVESLRESVGLQMLLGEILSGAGRVNDAADTYRRAHEEAMSRGELVTAALAEANRGEVLALQAQFRQAVELLEHAVEVLEQGPVGPELLAAYSRLAAVLSNQGLYEQALRRADQALNVAEQLESPPPRAVAQALVVRGSSKTVLGDSAAEADLLQALEYANLHDLTEQLMSAYDGLGFSKYLTVSAQAAVPLMEQAVGLTRSRGRRAQILILSGNLAEALAVAGRIDDAQQVCERAALTFGETDSIRGALQLRLYWSWVLSIRGDTDRVEALVAQALPAARGADPSALVAVLLVAIDTAHDEGEARVLTEELVTTLQNADIDGEVAQFLPRLTRVLGPKGRTDIITRIVGKTPTRMLFYNNNVLSARAVLAESEGNLDAALDLYTQANTAWAGYGYPLEQAHALLGAARCSLALDLPARSTASAARDLLAQLGAAPLLAETDHLIALIDAESVREGTRPSGHLPPR
jgi:class 3 adenylate cyclase/tetratricopeptide (TPR) repeat protein